MGRGHLTIGLIGNAAQHGCYAEALRAHLGSLATGYAQTKANELYREYTHLEPEYHQNCRDRVARYQAGRKIDYAPEP